MIKKNLLIGTTNPLSDLEEVKAERLAIKKVLDAQSPYVNMIRESDLSWTNLTNAFLRQDIGDAIEFFHYCGHSSQKGVLLEAGRTSGHQISVKSFTEFLSKRKDLKIVFLNSCSSQLIGQTLLNEGGVKVVIETVQPIYDKDARIFSEKFYHLLAKGKTIYEAFEEAKNMLVNTPGAERGKKRTAGFADPEAEKKDFAWQLNHDKNDPDDTVHTWRLYEPIAAQIDEIKGVKVLCVFPESEYTKDCYKAVKETLNAIKGDNSIYVESFVNLEKQGADSSSLAKFDSYLFFEAEDSISFLETHKEKFKGFIQEKTIGVLSCKTGIKINLEDIFDQPVKNVIELPFKGLSIDILNQESTQAKLLIFQVNFKPLLSFKDRLDVSVISNTLKTAFIDLNFKDQNEVIEQLIKNEVAQYNIFSIEGTEHCGHEVLIKKIITLINTQIIWQEVNVAIISLSKHFEATESLVEEDIWSIIADEVLVNKKLSRNPDALKTTNELLEIIKKQNLIISIEDAEFNASCYEAIQAFWKSFADSAVALESKHKLYFFVLNKGTAKGCCFSDKPIASHHQCVSIPFTPISQMEVSTFQRWYSSGSLYHQLKSDTRFTDIGQKKEAILKEPFVAKVIGQVCAQMDCKEIQEEVLSLKSRMK